MKRITYLPVVVFRRLTPVFLFLLVAVIEQLPIRAQCTADSCAPAAVPHAAVVRVAETVLGRSRCYGSGTLVHKEAERGIVLTCAHLFREEEGAVSVTFADGSRFEADLVAVDRAWDLAALEISGPRADPVPIAVDHPQPGDPLQSCGYGSDGRYWCNQGRALGYARTTATRTYETLELSGCARDGDSGGPVFNASGELVAVLWGTDGRMVGGTYCGRIRKFLGGILSPGSMGRRPPESGPPAPNAPPGSSGPAVLGDRLDGMRGRLDSLAAALEDDKRQGADRERSWGDRLEKVEQAVGLVAGLKHRVEEAEKAVGDGNLRSVVREVASGIVADRAPGLAQAVLPAVLAALGWTGPPSIAAIFAMKLAGGILRRRRSKRKQRASPDADRPSRESKPLNDDYAEQLARVYALSGRSPMADVTLGREYDEELRRAEQSSDTALARWARSLRERVARRFYRIHDESPLPSEPPDKPQRSSPRE
ncbi:MAG: trypsin-like peptidase domain-containing protein [Planctomycetes bacterium]|nr:trypsin-like peptidase domain-containing protein [Planctomycetota bacterium]